MPCLNPGVLASWALTSFLAGSVAAGGVPATSAGWSIELVAQAPDVSHPSVVSTAPDGRVFVAEDPMDIREDVVPHARAGRIWCLHPDGRRTLFADDLHAVFGLQYLEGKLYVLHNPQLTVFRDDAGTGRDRKDLLTHTLSEPWGMGWNDHIPANFKLGMDGWFYLAVGDKGLDDCTGSDGRQVTLPGGGIVRFRPDGSGLEIFATGVRNILDVAMNSDDEFFTYDNTDEHQWMGRLTHMVEAGDYGYPHNFIPRRPYTLWMMHDFGAGAACGTICNTDDALPPAMAESLFLADFGKRQVTRVIVARDGATYRVTGSEELFVDPPDDFRPVGITWSADGSALFICDWQHRDNKANVSVGRLWKLSRTDAAPAPRPKWWQSLAMGESRPDVPIDELLVALAHPARSVRLTAQRALAARRVAHPLATLLGDDSQPVRARIHALWALDAIDGGRSARETMRELAVGRQALLAAQSLRQLSQRLAPESVSAAVQALSHEAAPVRLQAVLLLGRVPAGPSVEPLMKVMESESDGVVIYALSVALRRLAEADRGALNAVVSGLKSPVDAVRTGCSHALRDFYSVASVEALARTVKEAPVPAAQAALQLLGPVARRVPSGRFVWWAYHPAKSPPPERTADWEGTDRVLEVLRGGVTHEDSGVRQAAAVALGVARDKAAASALAGLLSSGSTEPERLAALVALGRIDPARASAAAAGLLRDETPTALRLAALEQLAAHPDATAPVMLRSRLATGPAAEKPSVLRALARTAATANTTVLLAAAEDPALRNTAMLALAAAPDLAALPLFVDALASSDPVVAQSVRRAITRLGAAALPGVAARAESLPAGLRGTLRDLFKDVPEAASHPLFAGLPVAEAAAYEEYALNNPGDPWRGQQVFHGAAGLSCAACHQVAGHGGLIGPDLTLAGKQFSRREIIESILHPSRVVRDGYRQSVVTTTDGRELMGVARPSGDSVTLTDLAGQATILPTAQIKHRRELPNSLMPEGLQAALTLEQFADVVAYTASRTIDPRTAEGPPLPDGFVPLFNGRDLSGWRLTDRNRTHWTVANGRLQHDGVDGDLWHEKPLGDFELLLEWRWPGAPQFVELPVINPDGSQSERPERTLDAGDSGIFLRGQAKAQANLFCCTVGSGEFWEHRRRLEGDARRALTPSQRADAPLGDWNLMRITLRGDRATVVLNGASVITDAQLPELPARGPIGFQHEHGPVEFRTVAVREF